MKSVAACSLMILLFSLKSAFAERKPHVTLKFCENCSIEYYVNEFLRTLPRIKIRRRGVDEIQIRGKIRVELDMPPSNLERTLTTYLLGLPGKEPYKLNGLRYDFSKAKLRVDRKLLDSSAIQPDLFPEPFGKFISGAATRDLDTGIMVVDHVQMNSPDRNFKLSLEFLAAVLRGQWISGNETFDLNFVNFDVNWFGDVDKARYASFYEKQLRVIEAMLHRSVGNDFALSCEQILADDISVDDREPIARLPLESN